MFGWDDLAVAGVNLVGNWISGESNYNKQMRAMREQQAWQEKMNAQQQDWQEGMWNKTNEYNTPQAQLDRMVQAGINPNNAAMQVAGGSNNAQLASQPEIPGAASGFNPGMDLMNGVGSSLLASKQAKLLDEQAKKTEKEGKSIDEDIENKKMQNSVWMTNWNVDLALKKSNIDLNKETLNRIQYEVDVLLPQESEINQAELNNLFGAAIKLTQEVANLKKENKLIDEQINTQKAQQGLLAAETGEANARTDKTKSEKKSIDLQNSIDAVAAGIAEKYGIDPTKLDNIETINIELANAGYSEEQIEAFWKNTRGDLSSRFQNGLTKVLDNPGQAIGNAVQLIGKRRGRTATYTGSSKGSTPNPNPQSQPRPKRVTTKYYD